MFYIVRHLLEALVNPFFLILVLFAVFLIFLWRSKTKFSICIGFLSIFLLLILFSTGWLVEGLTRKLESRYPPVSEINPAVRWIVVLSGGQTHLTNMPTNNLLYGASIKRLVEAIRIYRQLPAGKIILSGGGYEVEISEATHLGELASWFAIPQKDLILETESLNTIGQVKAIKELVGDEPFYLVTSGIHMSRSLCLCKKYGLKPIPAPTDYTLYWSDRLWPIRYLPNPHNLFYLSIAMHELLGMAWASIRGDC